MLSFKRHIKIFEALLSIGIVNKDACTIMNLILQSRVNSLGIQICVLL